MYIGNNKKIDLIYKELSYEIVGILFEVYNEIGYGYQEKYYQRAAEIILVRKGIKFKKQVPYNLSFKGKIIGRYFLDFLIDGKIIVEIKKGNKYSKQNLNQVKGYLKATGLKLAILANFTQNGVKFLRVVNINDNNQPHS